MKKFEWITLVGGPADSRRISVQEGVRIIRIQVFERPSWEVRYDRRKAGAQPVQRTAVYVRRGLVMVYAPEDNT